MIDPVTMKLLQGLFGGQQAVKTTFSPFQDLVNMANPGEVNTPSQPGIGEMFSQFIGEKKDDAIGRFDQKKKGLMDIFKLFSSGGTT